MRRGESVCGGNVLQCGFLKLALYVTDHLVMCLLSVTAIENYASS